MKIGFIGMGHLGKTLAKRLLSQGVELIVWNRTREKAEDLGVEIADNPAALISRVQIVFRNPYSCYKDGAYQQSFIGLIYGCDSRGCYFW